jgi:hypothetical protein
MPSTSAQLGARARIAPAVLALLVVGVVLLVSRPAGAHSDDGRMTVTAAEQVGAQEVRVEVGIVYANDDDPAEEATVTATLTGPNGEQEGPVALARSRGALYEATMPTPVPGTWAVAVSSTGPVANATTSLEVTEDAVGVSSSTSTPAPSVATGEAAAVSAGDQGDDEGGEGFPVWILVVLIGVAIVAGVVLIGRSRASR